MMKASRALPPTVRIITDTRKRIAASTGIRERMEQCARLSYPTDSSTLSRCRRAKRRTAPSDSEKRRYVLKGG